MPKIITNITKQENDPWILIERTILEQGELFTQEEMNSTIIPFLDFVKNLPGYDYPARQFIINGNQATITMTFDTSDDMMSAKAKLFGPSVTDAVVLNKNALLKSKIESAGANYSVSVTLE